MDTNLIRGVIGEALGMAEDLSAALVGHDEALNARLLLACLEGLREMVSRIDTNDPARMDTNRTRIEQQQSDSHDESTKGPCRERRPRADIYG